MSSLLQLDPPLPVQTVNGHKGMAHFICDRGMEHYSLLLVAMDESRELWWFRQSELRIQDNITMGRLPKKINSV